MEKNRNLKTDFIKSIDTNNRLFLCVKKIF